MWAYRFASLRLDPEGTLPLLGLVDLRITLILFVLGGNGCRVQRGIHDRSLSHCHPTCAEEGFDHLIDLLTQIMLLQQLPQAKDRGLIRDPISDHADPSETRHDVHLVQAILHRWIIEELPLLQQADPQHPGQRVWRGPILLAGPGIVRLDQIDQGVTGHDQLHLRQELLALALLLGGVLLVTETELLAAHQSNPSITSLFTPGIL